MTKTLFVLLLLIGIAGVGIAAGDNYQPVVMEWDPVEGATEYILEIQNSKGDLLKTTKSKNATFRFRMPVGKYKIRSRVGDGEGTLSEWSELSALEVPPMPPAVARGEAPVKATVNAETLKAKVNLGWNQVPSAVAYQVEVFDKDKIKVAEVSSNKPSASVDLPPGKYTYQITSIADGGLASAPQLMEREIDVSAIKLKPVALPEDFDPVKKLDLPKTAAGVGTVGSLEYLRFFDENWKVVTPKIKLGEYLNTDGLQPGRYRLTVWAEAPGFIDSEKKSVEFVVKPTEERLKEILNQL